MEKSESRLSRVNNTPRRTIIHKVTTNCWNNAPGYKTSMTILILLFSLIVPKYLIQGTVDGYLSSVTITLQSKGMSYDKQSLLSFATFPFFTKIFVAPFIDQVRSFFTKYYFSKMGKCKTYIFFSGILVKKTFLLQSSGLMFCFSFYVQELIDQQSVYILFSVLCTLTFLASIQVSLF